jgi:hypothetical protein
MKLILLLIAIYSLIFYQHYKIQKSKASPRESEFRTTKSQEEHRLTDQPDYKTAIFLIRNNSEKLPGAAINRAGLYQ